MDNSHIAFISLLLRESGFFDFKRERPTSLGMNVDSLAKILICAAKLILTSFGGELVPTLPVSNVKTLTTALQILTEGLCRQ